MGELSKSVRQLIAADKLEEAIDTLQLYQGEEDPEIKNLLLAHSAALARNKKDRLRGIIRRSEEIQIRTQVRFAILDLVTEIEKPADENSILPSDILIKGNEQRGSKQTVFISYNHGDGEIAKKLITALRANGIDVTIDIESMKAGEKIEDFIENSIRNTDVTLSIVSNKSLLSAWVAMETINTFYHEKFSANRKFVAGFIDDDFFQIRFRLDATRQLDEKISEIDKLIPEYIENSIDTIDLNNEKSRLHKLRSSLGDILLRLKESLSLDLREDKFDESVAKIVDVITVTEK